MLGRLRDWLTQASKSRRTAWWLCALVPAVVVTAVSLGLWTPLSIWTTASGILTIGLVIAAAITDICWMKIPNWLTYPGVLWGVGINAMAGWGDESFSRALGGVGFSNALAGVFVPLAFMFLLFSMTGGGAGDIKLTAALGAFLGLPGVINAILFSFVIAGAGAVIAGIGKMGAVRFLEMIFRSIGSWVLPMWVAPPNRETTDMLRKPMALGPSFAIGTLLAMSDTINLLI